MADEDSRLDRRSVLKNAGLTAGAILGVSAPAAASDVEPDYICGYDCYQTNDICSVGPVYTYRVLETCQYSDGTVEYDEWYQCGCYHECNC